MKRKCTNPPPVSKKLRSQEISAPKYIIKNGLRMVEPYPYTYKTYAKQRWIGMLILEVFRKEFRDKPLEYYRYAIQNGRLRVNGAVVSEGYIVMNGDLISHEIHRHEPPVTASAIEIVHEDELLLIVNKPGSLPMHPVGRYHHNSLLSILRHEMGYKELHPVNRIDRLTSGLCIFALNKDKATELMNRLRDRQVEKTYLARVKGEFPLEMECHEPIDTASYKTAVNVVSSTGKECSTLFKRKSFNGRTSVVECRPKTGRTHQIRVHLQYLGYPISNDPIYCNSGWGKDLGKGGIPSENLKSIVDKVIESAFPEQTNVDSANGCIECQAKDVEQTPEQLYIYLHSLSYRADGLNYSTEMPEWANADYEDSHLGRFWADGGTWSNFP